MIRLRRNKRLVGYQRSLSDAQPHLRRARKHVDVQLKDATVYGSRAEAEAVAECFRNKTAFNLGGWTGAEVVEDKLKRPPTNPTPARYQPARSPASETAAEQVDDRCPET